MEEHAKIYDHFEEALPFDAGADLKHSVTDAYSPTTSYLIDREGKVLQVFPMEIYGRTPWWSLLNEMDRVLPKKDLKKKR